MPGLSAIWQWRRAGPWLAALLCLSSAWAAPRLDFRAIDSHVGLAQGSVHALLQDREGYVWIGTEGGLHRYDGLKLTVFQHDPDRADSLPDNLILALADAPGPAVWVATASGSVLHFDPNERRVTRIIGSRNDDPAGLLFSDAAERLWIARGSVIRLLAPPYDKAVDVYRFQHPITTLGGSSVMQMSQCPDGGIYAASSDGVLRLDATRATRIGPDRPSYGITCDPHNRLYASDEAGLAVIDRHSGARQSLWTRPAGSASMPGHLVQEPLVEDARGWLWLALGSDGLIRVRSDGEAATMVRIRRPGSSQAPDLSAARLLLDRSGLLWVGTQSHGVMLANPVPPPVARIVDPREDARTAARNNIRAVYQDSQGRYWLGTHGAGLLQYDLPAQQFHDHTPAILASLKLPDTTRLTVYSIAQAAAGALWLGSNLGALHYDPANGTARRLPLTIPVGPTAPIRDIYADRDGSLWLASIGHGVVHYRAGLGVIRHYGSADGLPDNNAVRITRDAGGQLWVGTLSGLARLDAIRNRFQAYHEVPGRVDSLAGQRVTDIRSAADGSLWIATDAGVNRLLSVDDSGAHFRRYLRRDGLPDTTAYCAIDGGHGKIWISSNLGISRLDPETGAIETLGMQEVLQGLEFNSAACLRDNQGALLFGGINGLNRFRPETIKPSRYLAPTVITGISLDGRRANPAQPVALASDMRVIGFDFAALDFTAPRKNQFRYRLLGLDAAWIDNGNDIHASYANLRPGNYRFEVQGSNHDGVFNPTPAAIDFHVIPPWWASTPAKTAAAAVAGLLLLTGILALRRRHRNILLHARELSESEQRFRLALWASGDQFWDWDLRSNTLHRVGTDQLSGGEPEQHLPVDEWMQHIVHPDDIPGIQKAAQAHLDGITPLFSSEHRITTASGKLVWVRSRGKIVERDANGIPVRLCGVVHNASQEREAEHGYRIAVQVLRSMTEAVAVTDLEHRFISVNQAFMQMLGYDEAEVLGQDASLINARQHSASAYREIREAVVKHGHWRGELWQRRKNGEEFLSWLELTEVLDIHDKRSHFVCVMTDITERKRTDEELRYLANYDSLTGLPNRTLLSEKLGHAIRHARRTGRKVAVLFIDLDRFKQINDSMGHGVGDRMLKAAGTRLRSNVREQDTVSRLGGDEFCVVLEDLADNAIVERVCAALIGAFEAPLQVEARQEIVISPSIGIALYPEHGNTPVDLLKFADTAMYQAKARGRNTWAMYTEAMDAQARRHATMLNALRQALHRQELSVVYQPKIDLDSWEITGVEALLRWHSNSLGEVPPAVFIPLAEEAGLIVEFGAYVLDQACAALARWRNHDVSTISMAVNISSAQLLGRTLLNTLERVLQRHRLDPGLIELELTESLVMTDAEASLRTLRELKQLGVRLAIDDFGTGYSSFSYLKRLPIDTLKIDKEFIGDLTTDSDDEEITTAIISMAHSLGLEVVAEGVQTLEQLHYLMEKNCDQMQGNWFSKPLPPKDCLTLLCRHDPATRPAPPRAEWLGL
ncbi:MAG TPA: EAL domain-containing protein [Rhodanobacteraceae bacterium]|nr:EAL domain-containing protein [Rhodanobacteraceae bacterium]